MTAALFFALLRAERRAVLRNLQVITGRPGWRLLWPAYLVFYTFCDFIVSYCFVPGASHEDAACRCCPIRSGAASTIDACLAGGRGLVVWTAHVANTEFASRLLELHGRPVNVARVVEPGNPAEAQLRDLMVNERLRVVDLSGPAGDGAAASRAAGGGDRRDAGRPRLPRGRRRRDVLRHGRRASRWGRSISPTPPVSPVVPGLVVRTGWLRYRMIVGPPLLLDSVRAARCGGARALGQAVSFLEAHLRRWHSQWLNFYDFWPASLQASEAAPGAPCASCLREERIMPRHAAVAVTGIGAISPYGLGWRGPARGPVGGPKRDRADRRAPRTRSTRSPSSGRSPFLSTSKRPRAFDCRARTGWPCWRPDRRALPWPRRRTTGGSAPSWCRRPWRVSPTSTPTCVRDPAGYYRRGGLGPASTYPVSHVADTVAATLGLGGPRLGISVACASGAMAIGVAARLIEEGRVRVALAGGSDALAAFTLAGFNALQALDGQPCRPFCQTRAGLNLGEGAAMLLLEDAGHARARGAAVLGWLSGWAFSNDAFHPTAPDEEGRGLALSMERAMQSAGVGVEDVGYVNAHGTGTRLNDAAEVKAYERAFAGRTAPLPVSSTKSHIGHTLGAAGAIEAVITLLALRSGTLFPTLRLERPIETASVDLLKSGPRRSSIEVAMSVSAGFGGSNASLVFQLAEGRQGLTMAPEVLLTGFASVSTSGPARGLPALASAGRASADRAVADREPAPGLPRAAVSSHRLRAGPAHPADGPAVGLGAARQRSRAPGRRHRCRGAGSQPHRRGLRNGLRVPRPDRGVPGRPLDERLASAPHPVSGDAGEPAGQPRRASLRDHWPEPHDERGPRLRGGGVAPGGQPAAGGRRGPCPRARRGHAHPRAVRVVRGGLAAGSGLLRRGVARTRGRATARSCPARAWRRACSRRRPSPPRVRPGRTAAITRAGWALSTRTPAAAGSSRSGGCCGSCWAKPRPDGGRARGPCRLRTVLAWRASPAARSGRDEATVCARGPASSSESSAEAACSSSVSRSPACRRPEHGFVMVAGPADQRVQAAAILRGPAGGTGDHPPGRLGLRPAADHRDGGVDPGARARASPVRARRGQPGGAEPRDRRAGNRAGQDAAARWTRTS